MTKEAKIVKSKLLTRGLPPPDPQTPAEGKRGEKQYRSLLYRFNILYLTRNLVHGGQLPNPWVRCALAGIVGPEVLTYKGWPLYPQVCYAVLVSICI